MMLTNQEVASRRVAADVLCLIRPLLSSRSRFTSSSTSRVHMKPKENTKPHVVAQSVQGEDWRQEVFLLLPLEALSALKGTVHHKMSHTYSSSYL